MRLITSNMRVLHKIYLSVGTLNIWATEVKLIRLTSVSSSLNGRLPRPPIKYYRPLKCVRRTVRLQAKRLLPQFTFSRGAVLLSASARSGGALGFCDGEHCNLKGAGPAKP